MKNKRISIISIIIIVLIVIIGIVSNNFRKKENETTDFIQEEDKTNNNIVTLNNRPGITSQIEFNGLSIYNTRLTTNNEVCVFEADVINLTNNIMPQCEKLAIFKNEKGNEVGRVEIYLDEIQPQQVSHFYSETPSDFKNAYTFEVVDIEK